MFDSVNLYWFTDELVKLAEDIQPGDIVIMSQRKDPTKPSPGIVGLFFGKLAPKVQGTLGHAGIVSPSGRIVESRIDEGITEKSFREAIKNKSYVIRRPPFSETTRRKAAEFAAKQVGKPYSKSDLLFESVGGVLPDSVTKSLEERLDLPRDRDGYTCSSLITAAYGSAKLSDISGRLATPGDFVYSDKLKTIKERVLKTAPVVAPTIGRMASRTAQ
jgi:uncharacterized protein YycO